MGIELPEGYEKVSVIQWRQLMQDMICAHTLSESYDAEVMSRLNNTIDSIRSSSPIFSEIFGHNSIERIGDFMSWASFNERGLSAKVTRYYRILVHHILSTWFIFEEADPITSEYGHNRLKELISELFQEFDSLEVTVSTLDPHNSRLRLAFPNLAVLLYNMANNSLMHGTATKLNISINDHYIIVSDNGTGFETSDKVFKYKYTTGNRNNGRQGIGLGLMQEVFAAFGATIECDGRGGLPNKQGGHGAKFVITLQKAA